MNLLGKGVDEAAEEVKRAAQQAQVTLAAAHELIANINEIVLVVKRALAGNP